ncbi:DNA repair protein RadA [Fusibacter ferrireducens]|uniref:DNA repair protein RadA n=1 Tax=Fusibacter ferrireducens TaxID=2785058 RepID=A0ABR9ZZS0_9FIRM|nr:DNA repair protein RadA [Fusibacter ferrireducens]MBF4695948.1 DNA repair protein RadA [Fusibacter ferrireducens]
MSKAKTKFVCQNCGYISPKWLGKCLECGEWNSFVEDVEIKETKTASLNINSEAYPQKLKDIAYDHESRVSTRMRELDIVLGGGLVNGSLILVGGDPGIGKSTLLLQVANNLSMDKKIVLYVSGEESIKQTKLRAERLSMATEELYIMAENNIERIKYHVEQLKPHVLIVDSIQTVFNPEISSAPGTVSQVRESTNQFMNIAKKFGVTTFIVGHVTKQGAIAGPKILEHMVDTVLYFEGERQSIFRILRAVKNRFGSTNEIGIFEMTNLGLIEVDNPSKIFLTNSSKKEAGSVIIPTLEGTRTVLVEIQCLASQTNFNMPRRMAIGIDYNRLVLLTAVLEKKVGMSLYNQDIYLNVVGGMSLDEPAADLAVVMAIASSFREVCISSDMVIFGEVGLTGEIRTVNQVQQRVNEASKMGFKKAIIPKSNLEGIQRPDQFTIIGMQHIEDVFKYFF